MNFKYSFISRCKSVNATKQQYKDSTTDTKGTQGIGEKSSQQNRIRGAEASTKAHTWLHFSRVKQ